MEIDKYMGKALRTATYRNMGINLIYPCLGLAGEAGEVANNMKKLIRDHGYKEGMNPADFYQKLDGKGKKLFEDTIEELGDVMWYLAACSYEFGTFMNSVAKQNIDKLEKRHGRKKHSLIDNKDGV